MQQQKEKKPLSKVQTEFGKNFQPRAQFERLAGLKFLSPAYDDRRSAFLWFLHTVSSIPLSPRPLALWTCCMYLCLAIVGRQAVHCRIRSFEAYRQMTVGFRRSYI